MPAWEAVQIVFGLACRRCLLTTSSGRDVANAMYGTTATSTRGRSWDMRARIPGPERARLALFFVCLDPRLHRDSFLVAPSRLVSARVPAAADRLRAVAGACAARRRDGAVRKWSPSPRTPASPSGCSSKRARRKVRSASNCCKSATRFSGRPGRCSALTLAARGVRDSARCAARCRHPVLRRQRGADPAGWSVLEASRQAGIPHASVCGGRGRCSTCRIRVAGDRRCRRPRPLERRVLERVGAPPNVRLACQLRPTRDLCVTPLLPPTAAGRRRTR